MEVISDPKVKDVFEKYPKAAKHRLSEVRALVMEAANEIEGLSKLEVTLKWGEPSFLTKHGSTIRMDWKKRSPDQFAIYFKCTSKLVPTFKTIYHNKFTFEGNRAMVFDLDQKLPKSELKHCFTLALTYHKVKHLPLLGA